MFTRYTKNTFSLVILLFVSFIAPAQNSMDGNWVVYRTKHFDPSSVGKGIMVEFEFDEATHKYKVLQGEGNCITNLKKGDWSYTDSTLTIKRGKTGKQAYLYPIHYVVL